MEIEDKKILEEENAYLQDEIPALNQAVELYLAGYERDKSFIKQIIIFNTAFVVFLFSQKDTLLNFFISDLFFHFALFIIFISFITAFYTIIIYNGKADSVQGLLQLIDRSYATIFHPITNDPILETREARLQIEKAIGTLENTALNIFNFKPKTYRVTIWLSILGFLISGIILAIAPFLGILYESIMRLM